MASFKYVARLDVHVVKAILERWAVIHELQHPASEVIPQTAVAAVLLGVHRQIQTWINKMSSGSSR